MKRVLMALLFAVAMLASITCYAQITVADLNIGGIYYGMPEAEVIEKLGQPIRREQTPPAGSAPVFKCGNAEIIVGNGPHRLTRWARVLSGDGVYTGTGIGIGSSYDEVIKAYGHADIDTFLAQTNHNDNYVEYQIPNIQPREIGYLIFEFNQDKKVIRLSFGALGENE